jgi:hypothetical protein
MTGRSFSEDLSNEMTGKAILWGPAIAGAALLGPAGIALGLLTSVVIVASGGSSDSPPSNGEQSEK